MTVELIPIKQFSKRISEGWQMIPGYDLKAGDYAVIMIPPTGAQFWTSNKERGDFAGEVQRQAAAILNNRSRGRRSALSRKLEAAE